MGVLVTGNEGYVGSILWPMLPALTHEVASLGGGHFWERASGKMTAPMHSIWLHKRDVERRHCSYRTRLSTSPGKPAVRSTVSTGQ